MASKRQRELAIKRAVSAVRADRTGFRTRAGTWRPRSESAPGPLKRKA